MYLGSRPWLLTTLAQAGRLVFPMAHPATNDDGRPMACCQEILHCNGSKQGKEVVLRFESSATKSSRAGVGKTKLHERIALRRPCQYKGDGAHVTNGLTVTEPRTQKT